MTIVHTNFILNAVLLVSGLEQFVPLKAFDSYDLIRVQPVALTNGAACPARNHIPQYKITNAFWLLIQHLSQPASPCKALTRLLTLKLTSIFVPLPVNP